MSWEALSLQWREVAFNPKGQLRTIRSALPQRQRRRIVRRSRQRSRQLRGVSSLVDSRTHASDADHADVPSVPPGRPRGTLNRVTVEVRAAAAALVNDPQYRQKLLRDMRKRRVLPAVETMLWHYAKGKPVERHEIATPGDVCVSNFRFSR